MGNSKILISAYSCEPDKGSEPGVGWDYIRSMSKFYDLVVLTRADKKEIIEKNKIKNVDFHFVDLPLIKKNISSVLWHIYIIIYGKFLFTFMS